MNKQKEVLVLGFALFAMFFGAGNLMFPPSLGMTLGKDWFLAGIGFLLTGVGLPLLGVLAFTRVGNLENFSARVSRRFNTIYCTTLVIVIGPLFAIPRTGSTTFEMGVLPLFPDANLMVLSIVSSIIFFGLTLMLVIKESKITDVIGKFLTPIILVILSLVAYFGITGNIGTPVDKNITNVFGAGFVNGYQTMDALASVIFGVIIIKVLENKGITNEKEQKFYLSGSAIIAATGLGLIYFSLMFLGSKISGIDGLSTTQAILYIAEATLGSAGKIAFGVCVATACLTTSVGLVAIASDWFARFTPISYKTWAYIISIFSGVIAIGGVDFIIQLSIPVLCILYPVTIILILLNICGIEDKLAYRLATYVTLLVITLEVLGNTFKITSITNTINMIPFASQGFAWLTPCLAALILAFIVSGIRRKNTA